MQNENDTQTAGGQPLEAQTGGANSSEATQAAGKPANADGKLFSQDEVDRIIKPKAERLARKLANDLMEQELPNRLRTLLEERGFDPDNLDTMPKQKEAMERAHQAQLTREKNARLAAEKERDDVKTRWERDRIDRFILEKAKSADPPAFLKLARDHFGLDGDGKFLVRDENGEPLDGMEPEKFLKKLLDDHPALAAPVGNPGAGSRAAIGRTTEAARDLSKLPFDHADRKAARLQALREGFGER